MVSTGRSVHRIVCAVLQAGVHHMMGHVTAVLDGPVQDVI